MNDVLDQPVDFHYKDGGKLTTDEIGAYAMHREYLSGHKDYFIKFATAGPGEGNLLNPWGLYFTPGDEYTFEKKMGRYRYIFKPVSQAVFNNYIKFLQTRNERYLVIIERELRNG